MKPNTTEANALPRSSVGSGAPLGMYKLQVKDCGQWKTVRRNSDGEYLKLVAGRHWSRYAKHRILKLA